MTTTPIVIYGNYHLIGKIATVVICGLDCGDYTVASDGSVTVPWGSDPDQVLSPYYLIQQNGSGTTAIALTDGATTTIVLVPVQVGLCYVAWGKTLRPVVEGDVKSPQGSGLAKVRRLHQFGAQLQNTQGIEFGTTTGDGPVVTFSTDPLTASNNPWSHNQLFNGVWWGDLPDASGFDGVITWKINRPYPAMITALTAFLEVAER